MDNDNPVKELIDEQLASDINEILETVEAGVEGFGKHTKDLNNPHQTTKEQVGLGNVDNTSDVDKPISNAVSSAIKSLEGKINSVNSAVNTLENKVDSAVNTLNTKVDSAVNTLNNKVDSNFNTVTNKIDSAVKTLDNKMDSELEKAKAEVLQVVDDFKVNVETPISAGGTGLMAQMECLAQAMQVSDQQIMTEFQTYKEEQLKPASAGGTGLYAFVEAAKNNSDMLLEAAETRLQGDIDTNNANAESAINTLSQNLNDVKSALQTHNHDEMYVKVGDSGSNVTTITTNEYGTWRETPLSNGTVLLEGHGFLSNDTSQVQSKTINLLKQCRVIDTYIGIATTGPSMRTNVCGRVKLTICTGNTWSENAMIVTDPLSFRVDVPACQGSMPLTSLLWWEFMGYLA